MMLLTLGSLLIVFGTLSISFPELCKSLRVNDQPLWETLGSPNGHSFADLGKSLGLFSWILAHGYQKSISTDVIALGNEARKKAQRAKFLLITGILLLVIGFVVALLG